MAQTARRAFVAAVVFVGVVALALALWKPRLLITLLFLALVVAAAMRPGVDWLRKHGIPRGVGVAVHYVAFAGFIAFLLWLAVPRALDQASKAIGGDVPTSQEELRAATQRTTGIAHTVLEHVQKWLAELPGPTGLIDPALHWTELGLKIAFGILFTLAAAAYWIFERERAMALVVTLLPTNRRRLVTDTWELIELKLGAYVRGQLLLIVFVGTVLSFAFWAIGLPYWLLPGTYAGIVEIIPIVGPLIAGAAAIGVGLTVSWQLGLAAGVIVLVVRQIEDYVVIPQGPRTRRRALTPLRIGRRRGNGAPLRGGHDPPGDPAGRRDRDAVRRARPQQGSRRPAGAHGALSVHGPRCGLALGC